MKQNETDLQTVSAAQWQYNEVIQAIGRNEAISVLHALYSTFRRSVENIIKEYAEITENGQMSQSCNATKCM
jgi:hypothetical protein